MFTLRKPYSPLVFNGKQGFLRVHRLYWSCEMTWNSYCLKQHRISPNKRAGYEGRKQTLIFIWFQWPYPCQPMNKLTLSAGNWNEIGSGVSETWPEKIKSKEWIYFGTCIYSTKSDTSNHLFPYQLHLITTATTYAMWLCIADLPTKAGLLGTLRSCVW